MQCTPPCHPQWLNIGYTVTNAVIHKPIAALAEPSRSCPQIAQALILVLRFIHQLFFKEQACGHVATQHLPTSLPLGLSAFAISFQDRRRSSTVVIRLRCGRPGGYLATGVHGGAPKLAGPEAGCRIFELW